MTPTHSIIWLLCGVLLAFARTAFAMASTDTITWGGDVSRCGYETTHNMDPAIVSSGSFGQIFKTALPGNFNNIGPEQVYSQPLVYTGADGVQYVYAATTQNNIYKLNAKTGAIVSQRNLWVPFLAADLGNCNDLAPAIGVTGTGVIDPSTGIWYFTAKTYSNAFQNTTFGPKNPPGRLNARYYFHAINTADLTDAFAPTPLEGTLFRNNPNRMFISGNQHQRPALLQVGDFIYSGWASHCVQYNYTGAIIGFNRNTGAIVEAFATEGGPEANTVPGGGVWMSGGGIAYDGKGSMYFATGNGWASQLAATGQSLSGRNPPTSLEEAVVNAKINSDGTLSIVDFFMPWEKTQLDGADKDLGVSPLEILPSSTFTCPNHKRIGVVTGKSGKTYWLNLDDLGGYQMGPKKLDNVIQVFQNENAGYAGAGVLPLAGGYVYLNVIGYQSHVFQFSCDATGNAVFTKVANTAEKGAVALGVGHGATTSLNGQDSSGLYWVTDVEGLNLRIYNPIPSSTGANLTLVNSFNVPGVTKFSRPVFGDGRAYVAATGYLYAFGSPISLPINCSSPYVFNQTSLGNSSQPVTVTCVSNIQTTVNSIALTGNSNFIISNVPSTPLTLSQGSTFNFTAVFSPAAVGLLSSDVVVNTTNGVTGYSTSTPITLKGQANSAKPLLAISPNTVSFSTIAGQAPDTQSVIFSNNGNGLLTFQNISYSLTSETGPWVTPNTTSDGNVQVGAFTFTNVPTSIPGNTNNPVTISYNPSGPGNDAVYIKAFSNGGNALLDVLGVAGSQPIALFQFQTPDGTGWVNYVPGQNFTFGNVTENTTRNLKFRITNNGSSTAAPLALTVSKPPYGMPGILGAQNNIDLAEGTLIAAGQSQNATLYCSPPKVQVNTPGYTQSVQWTVNTNDLTSGKQFFTFVCNEVSEQGGPLYPNGTSRYGYVGCAVDNVGSRQLRTQIYVDATNNTNDKCTSACFAQGWTFAGTQYQQECWCGNAIPLTFDTDASCNSLCTGGVGYCGGNVNGPRISLFADSSKFNGNTTSPPLQMVQSYNNYNYVGCYAETNGKTLSAKGTTSNNMTVSYCGAFCSAYGYTYFGLEYAQECYCGNSLLSSATLTQDSQCSMVCANSNSQYCGAGNRMQVYGLNGTIATSSSASVTATTTDTATGTTSVASPTSTGPVAPATVGKYVYLGCYSDSTASRTLQGSANAADSMTNQACATFCAAYTYFATEYTRECYCGNTILNGAQNTTDGRCSMTCGGDSTQICGGQNGLSLYRTNSTPVASTPGSTPSPTPTPSAVQSVGNYVSMGCYSDNTNGVRVLATQYVNDSMTIEMCAARANISQAPYFGVEYGRECWYGPSLGATSQPLNQTKCNMLCPGNSLEWCGAGNALQMYNLTAVSAVTNSSASSTTSSSITVVTSSSWTVVNSSSAVVTSSSLAAANSTAVVTSSSSAAANSSSAVVTSSASSTASSSITVVTSSSWTVVNSSSAVVTSSSSAAFNSSSAVVTSSSSVVDNSSSATITSSSSTVASSSSTTTTSSASAGAGSSGIATSSATAVTSTTTTKSTTTSSAVPSQTPLSCPASNSTVWTAPSGAKFLIECGIDHYAGDINSTTSNSFEACITACDKQKGCVDISLSGVGCYMKGTVGRTIFSSGILGAKLLPANSTSSVSATTTPASK